MSLNDIIASIDAELTSLQTARAILAGIETSSTSVKRGRPAKGKRTLSPATRAKIAEAQRKRWAAQKKAAKV